MPSSEAIVPTERASRYLVQLCRHLGEMGRMHGALARGHGGGGMPRVQHVEWSDEAGLIRFPDGTGTLRATPDALVVRLDADDDASLAALQRGFANRLETIGRREGLRLEWRAAGSPVPASASASEPARPDRRRPFLLAVGFAAVAAVVVAVHLAIGGALVAAPWTGLAGGALVAVLALAAVVVVAHLAIGGVAVSGVRLAHGRRRPAPPRDDDPER